MFRHELAAYVIRWHNNTDVAMGHPCQGADSHAVDHGSVRRAKLIELSHVLVGLRPANTPKKIFSHVISDGVWEEVVIICTYQLFDLSMMEKLPMLHVLGLIKCGPFTYISHMGRGVVV